MTRLRISGIILAATCCACPQAATSPPTTSAYAPSPRSAADISVQEADVGALFRSHKVVFLGRAVSWLPSNGGTAGSTKVFSSVTYEVLKVFKEQPPVARPQVTVWHHVRSDSSIGDSTNERLREDFLERPLVVFADHRPCPYVSADGCFYAGEHDDGAVAGTARVIERLDRMGP